MATYYVTKTGNNANSGLIGFPKLTITGVSGGLSVLASGDTLNIGTAGQTEVYAEAINSVGTGSIPSGVNASTHTIVQALTGATVILRPSSANDRTDIVSFGTGKQFITLQGNATSYLTLDGVNLAPGTNCGITFCGNSNNILINRLEIKNTQNSGISNRDETVSDDKHHLTIRACSIHDLGINDFCHGVYWRSRDNTVEDCDLYNLLGFGTRLDIPASGIGPDNQIYRRNKVHNTGGWGMNFGNGGDHVAYNNIIWNCGAAGAIAAVTCLCVRLKFYNNTIYNCHGTAVYINPGSADNDFRNNIFYQLSAGGTITDNGTSFTASNNLTTDPSFVDANNGDFHLQSGSAALNAGADLTATVPTDYDLNSRPQGAAVDIGAFERVSGSMPTLTTVSPNTAAQNTSIPVTLTGTNFSYPATIAVSGTGVTVPGTPSVDSATQIRCDFIIAANATTGVRTVSVTTTGGTSGTQNFTVSAASPITGGLAKLKLSIAFLVWTAGAVANSIVSRVMSLQLTNTKVLPVEVIHRSTNTSKTVVSIYDAGTKYQVTVNKDTLVEIE